ncbi:DNA-directed RNA polymerase subunit N [Candidatus Dojkabacteria bacterium]|uniref:DNA-directed RNA polymerase subunit N n=1 Tax=Candidatus Dojkabacteria bacterium TaxID=2099670 RepID=A0A5C7J4L7_9BACT|nr:MAG: DNA-directed RNA polymerase subunit N [Candidatus Dojkabacteria bacterium]
MTILGPVVCLSCGIPVGEVYHEYRKLVKKGLTPADAFDKLGVLKLCCRSALHSTVSIANIV